ncbi:PAS domain S-box protein [Aliiglaciecola sp. 2_MG-2023]|uniref:PAS domain S-box protein n=1 Tax=unclassified Aliiglaciecola TaxID=2593648 RepID=UPI0026E43841|nr:MULTISPECIES: PAS domain S-box protein [unclassified Aliiglaciecola]MDO6710558.1 PAS domain S-box protein [Aliiglaciecola sp. 2_MG-2023]MDO6751577.1 PAS domain S-box protein [Aliiglaciecola sp. 1_MG-2023]
MEKKINTNKWRISFSPQIAILIYAVIAGAVTSALIAFLILYIETQERAYIDNVTQTTANKIKILLEEDINTRIVSLTEFAQLSKISNNLSDADWNLIAQTLYDTQQGYQAISWVDSTFQVKKVLPVEQNEIALNIDLNAVSASLSAAVKAQNSTHSAFTIPISSVDGKSGFGIYAPVFKGLGSTKQLQGFIGSVFLFNTYFKEVLPSYLLSDHQILLTVDGLRIYPNTLTSNLIDTRWNKHAAFTLEGQNWQINIAPTNEFLAHKHYRIIKILTLLGVLLSFFVALAFYAVLLSRRKEKYIKDDRKKTEHFLKMLPGMAYQSFNEKGWPIILVNEECEELTGYSKDEFARDSIIWGQIIHPDDYERIVKLVDKAVKQQRRFEFEYRIVTKNNEIKYVWERGEPVRSHLTEDFILEGFITDITSIKQAQADLIHSHAFSEAIVNSVVEAVITIDQKGNIKSFNKAALKMFGYSFKEIKDKNVKILMPQRQSEQHDQYLAKYLETNETHIIGTGRVLTAKRKDGSMFPIHLSVSEIVNPEGRVFVGLIRDITEQIASEDKTRRLTEQLAHFDRLNALGEMAVAVAHEINQPLTAIALFSATAKNMCEKQNFEMLPELLDKLTQQSLRAGSVLERVQIMTRKGDSQKEAVDSNILIEEVIKLIEPISRLHEILIQVETGDQHVAVFVDRVQIQQVILNLLRNAMESMQAIDFKNGNVLTIRASQSEANTFQISIEDTGCGLSQKLKDELYTPFSTTKKNGMGIGLSISKSIIEEHGGHLMFKDNKPYGTVFYFTLPISGGKTHD